MTYRVAVVYSILITIFFSFSAAVSFTYQGHIFDLSSANVKADGMTNCRDRNSSNEQKGQYGPNCFQMICKYTEVKRSGCYNILTKSCKIVILLADFLPTH